MSIEDIVLEIESLHPLHTVTVIAIEGFGGSGKSTLAEKLRIKLKDAYVISIDDFILKENVRDSVELNFDRARLEREVLLPIKNGDSVHYRRLEWSTNTLSSPIEVPHTKYLILEGVSTFHPSIIEYMDYKIWIETERDIAKERGSKRDRELGSDHDELWEHWTKTYQEYKDLYQPEKKADVVYFGG